MKDEPLIGNQGPSSPGPRVLFRAPVKFAVGLLVFASLSALLFAFYSQEVHALSRTAAAIYGLIQLLCAMLSVLLVVFLVRSYRIRLGEIENLSRDLVLRSAEAQAISNDLNIAQTVAHIGSWVYDFATDNIEMSAETCRIFGLPEGSHGTRHGYLRRIHPDDLAALDQAWDAALRGELFYSEHRIRIDNSNRWICQRAEVEYEHCPESASGCASRGRPLRCVGTTQDITALKQAEEELRIAATAFEAQEGMLITDASMTVLRVNAAFTRVTGYSPADMIGQTPRRLKSGRHDAAFYKVMWDRIGAVGSWQGEIWNRRKSGEVYPEWLTITAVKNGVGIVTHYVGTLTDITQRKTAEDEIRHLAFYDPLTRLPNRRLLLDRLQQAMASSARSGRQGAVMFLDLDNFKALNDSQGHDKGDVLLQHVAQRLSTCIREGDTVSRFGGDEFVVMLVDLSTTAEESRMQADVVGEKILETLSEPYDLNGHAYRCTASIGITLFSNHQSTSFELLKQADLAMYEAKATGRNAVRFFAPATPLSSITNAVQAT